MGPVGVLVNPPLFWGTRRTRISMFEQTRRSVGTAEALADFPGEHLGLASIAAYCRHRGQRVAIVNGLAAEHLSVDETFEAIRQVVARDGVPLLIGFSGTSLVHRTMTALVARCKQAWPDARTILGYDFATLNYERLINGDPNVDFVCRGDGEVVFSTLLDRLGSGGTVEDIPGLAYRGAGGVAVANAPSAVDINQLPWPVRDDLPQVLRAGLGASVYASRGCPYRCSYCALGETSSLFGKDAYRLRDLEPIVEEIAFLRRDYGIANVTIVDDLFLTRSPSSRARAEEFADLLLARNLGVEWMMDCRVDSIDGPLFKHLHRSGLRKIFVGVETPDPEQLARYNKRYLIKRDRPQDRLQLAIDAGVIVVPGVLTYHPKSTPRELRNILDFVDQVGWQGKYQLMNRIRAYPGTPLFEEYRREGLLQKGEWPTEDWVYADPRIEQMAMRVSFEAMRPDTTFKQVRDVFANELATLSAGKELAALHLDEAAEAAIAAGLETAGGGDD